MIFPVRFKEPDKHSIKGHTIIVTSQPKSLIQIRETLQVVVY